MSSQITSKALADRLSVTSYHADEWIWVLVLVMWMGGELRVVGQGRAGFEAFCLSAVGLHAECPWEGNRSAENYSEGTGQEATQGDNGSSTQR